MNSDERPPPFIDPDESPFLTLATVLMFGAICGLIVYLPDALGIDYHRIQKAEIACSTCAVAAR
jgi:hypothetical protein